MYTEPKLGTKCSSKGTYKSALTAWAAEQGRMQKLKCLNHKPSRTGEGHDSKCLPSHLPSCHNDPIPLLCVWRAFHRSQLPLLVPLAAALFQARSPDCHPFSQQSHLLRRTIERHDVSRVKRGGACGAVPVRHLCTTGEAPRSAPTAYMQRCWCTAMHVTNRHVRPRATGQEHCAACSAAPGRKGGQSNYSASRAGANPNHEPYTLTPEI